MLAGAQPPAVKVLHQVLRHLAHRPRRGRALTYRDS